MFSFVSLNWRGRPLESLEVIINLIAEHDDQHRPEALRPARRKPATSEASRSPTNQLAAVNITRHAFHGDWNYTINPSQ